VLLDHRSMAPAGDPANGDAGLVDRGLNFCKSAWRFRPLAVAAEMASDAVHMDETNRSRSMFGGRQGLPDAHHGSTSADS
jgi:hypothetical protein